MTEFEKMQAGLLYRSRNEEMEKRRSDAKDTCHAYNSTWEGEAKKRRQLLEHLLGAIGEGSRIERSLMVEYGHNIFLGRGVYINFDSILLDCAPITIGDDVWFGPRVCVYTVNHSMDRAERVDSLCRSAPVTVEDGVWVGGNSVLLAGVSIGANSVIGAGSVVTKDIPAGVFAAGNPCRVIRPITEEDRLEPPPV